MTRRTPVIIVAIVVGLALLGAGWWAASTRPRGTPQAVEFAEAQLSRQMTGAKILALGEATHGNAEYQQLRTALVAATVDHGFATVVLEEDWGQTYRVNEFIQGGPGTAQEAAQRFGFRIQHTTQVAEWLTWLRDHNANAPADAQITLVGMDMQRSEASLGIIADALDEADPQGAALAREAADAADNVDPQHDTLDAALLEQLSAAVEGLSPGESKDTAARAVDSLEGYLALEAAQNYGEEREERMFANLERIVAETDDRLLLFAHTGHVAKVPNGALGNPLGARAADAWGEDYRVIGTDFVHTEFLSGTREERRAWTLTNRTPLRGMYEGTDVGYVEFATLSGANADLVGQPVAMGSAGEGFTRLQQVVPFFHTVTVVPVEAYDALILVQDATPVQML